MKRTSISPSFIILVCLLLIWLYSITACRTTKSFSSGQQLRHQIVQSAMKMIGAPYEYAGKDQKGFDCSGLTHYVYRENGVMLTGSSANQATIGKKITLSETKPGDLVFFKRKKEVFHVGIITESNSRKINIIHSTTSRGVILENILDSQYWKPKIYMYRTLLE